jgi:Serine dehydrogenase proteinase
MNQIKSDDIIQDILISKCRELENHLDGDAILIRSPMAPPLDDFVRREVENLSLSADKRDRLIVFLETSGGSVEVVERISDVFRHHYNVVDFVIPNYAYSAGTVLTLSADEIYMDYYSVLGPIDPQIKNRDGRWVPGLGYLEKYKDLIEKSMNGQITPAEMEFLVRKFDPAELFALEQAKKHSADLIQTWLCQYKFKNWTKRRTSNQPVDSAYKSQRAADIAGLLGDATEWNSHGRGIPLRVLESDRIKLQIRNFGDDPTLNAFIRGYYDLFIDYCTKIGNGLALHTRLGLITLGG